MSKHTPGPWAVFGRAGYAGHKVGDCTARSVAAFPSTSTRSEDERNANARLIAEAPNLLAACKQLVEAVGNPTDLRLGSEQLQRFISAWGDMRAAITKAEGAS